MDGKMDLRVRWSLGDSVPLRMVGSSVPQRDEMSLAELLEELGGKLAPVIQDDGVRGPEVCHVLL